MNKKVKKFPEFKNEDEEREFWSKNDSTDYIDWEKAQSVVFPKLKPSTRTISLRLTEDMLYDLKRKANRRDVPYQSLIKILLKEDLKKMAAN